MPEELVTIATFQFVAEADAARMFLEAEGIPAFLADATIVSMDWMLGNAIGNVKLQVSSERADDARALIDAARSRRGQRQNDDDNVDAETCLACGAVLPAGQSVCPACGWSYASSRSE